MNDNTMATTSSAMTRDERMKGIYAKKQLGLTLSTHEQAMLALYGKKEEPRK